MGWPLVGESLHFALQGAHFFVERFAKYGRIYKTHLLGSPTVRVTGAELIWPLVSREPHLLTMKLPRTAMFLFGPSSLMASSGQDHASLKKKLLASVTPLRLGDYLPCIQQHVRSHILSWCQRGKIRGFPACEELMSDLMLEIVLGWRKERDKDGLVKAAFATANQNLLSFPVRIPGTGFYKAEQAKRTITDFVRERLGSEGDKDHLCMLDVFLAHHGRDGQLTQPQILDNLVTFLLAGTGTTSSAICSALLLLGRHGHVLSSLRQELHNKGLTTGTGAHLDLTYDLLQSLEFCQAVCKEVLRLQPPVGGLFRRAEKTLDVAGYQIPRGWTVMYSVRDTHFSSSVFKDRDEFQPWRWMDKSLEDTLRTSGSCNYLPFGSGPRLCVGKNLALLEMSVFLVEVARLTDWTLVTPNPDMIYLPVTKPADDLPVVFSRRISIT